MSKSSRNTKPFVTEDEFPTRHPTHNELKEDSMIMEEPRAGTMVESDGSELVHKQLKIYENKD